MYSTKLEDVVRMALYHPENWIRSKAKNRLDQFSYDILSCFECNGGVYMSVKKNNSRKDIRLCNAPEEYFGIKSPESYPFIVTIGK